MKQSDRPPLTSGRLREVLRYSPNTGLFIRNSWVGRVVSGCIAKNGYVFINIDGSNYPAHRVAWLYVTGSWPTNNIDHIDGNPTNNRWDNLRDVPHSVNMQNRRRAHSNNKLGLLGVHLHKNKYVARIGVGGRKIHLGSYVTPDLAYQAYLDAKRNLHVGCTI